MPSPQSMALAKALDEIQRQLLPLVEKKAFGKVSFEVEINAGRIVHIVKQTAQSFKIELTT